MICQVLQFLMALIQGSSFEVSNETEPIEKSKIALQMESSFRDGNEAGANQQIKHETSQHLWCTGMI